MLSVLLAFALAAPPQACPVQGAACACGCREGKTCNCAAPTRDFGHEAYDALVRRLKPGDRFRVYVGCNMPPYDEGSCVRWDNYPGVTGPAVIVGEIRPDGSPWTVPPAREVAPVYRPVLQPFGGFFGGGCASGRCR